LAGALTTGKWFLLTAVLDGTTGYFYINGALKSSQTGITVSMPSSAIYIGTINGGNLYLLASSTTCASTPERSRRARYRRSIVWAE
jgi:hypothetical protein